MVEEMFSPSQLVANKFNPNVMQPEEFAALKKDMQNVGPKEIDMVLVSPYDIFYIEVKDLQSQPDVYVIVDGEHRWTASKELLWSELRCDVKEITEEDAKGICYRKNKDRGTIDPFKEAALFKSEVDLGLTQKEIAEKFIVDSTTVSHRLSLLKLVPEIKEEISKMPRGMITPSHLEPIATLPEGEQKKISLTRWGDEIKPVQDIAEEVRRVKQVLSEKEELKKAVAAAKFPNCPKCGKEPAGESYSSKFPFVRCSSGDYYHSWNLQTGKMEHELVKVSESLDEKKEPQISGIIRSNFTIKQLAEAFFNSIHAVLPDLDSASKISINGKLKGEPFSLNFEAGSARMSVSVSQGENYRRHLSFSAEAKDYQSGHKSKVDIGVYQPKQKDLDQHAAFIDNAFKNVLLPLPEKKPHVDVVAENLPKISVYCTICNQPIEESNAYRHDGKVYCGYHAMLCNVPPLGCEDDALTKKALKEREQLRGEGKVLPYAVVEASA